MPALVALDNVLHAKLRVKPEYGSAYNNNVNQVAVFPTEFQMLAREYPIFFRKSEEGKFYAVSILGLDKDENLFLDGANWKARYVPAVQMRGPFLLEMRETAEGQPTADPLVRINMDDPRVNEDEGESVFLAHGGYSDYFESILQALRRIHIGAQTMDAFFEQLSHFDLIEPITVQASIGESTRYTLPDLFTIGKERMAKLDGASLEQLNQQGLLEHCFAVMSSINNMSYLTDMKAIK